MAETRTSTIVDVEWLRSALGSRADVVVIEITNVDSDTGATGAIPGARAVFWKSLLWHDTRRELATAATLSRRLQALGVGADSTVVFAGEPTQFAAYAVWAATVVGLADRVHYLDGGVGAWRAATPLTEQMSTAQTSARVVGSPAASAAVPSGARPSVLVDRAGVLAALDSPNITIVDLRSPEEFSGLRVAPWTEPIDHGAQRHGRIPGARSLHVAELLDHADRILPVERLQERVREAGVDDADDLVFYCRLSHRAALGWLIFRDVLGDDRVRVYDGSWTEWGSVVGAPIEL
ncbi:sulfurtransferase [Williamsia sp. M5A3_1d]